jgi:ABC-type dipeptide/oligopeptide/nickel transport system ATPase subunit
LASQIGSEITGIRQKNILKAHDLTKTYHSGSDENRILNAVSVEIAENDCREIIGKFGGNNQP